MGWCRGSYIAEALYNEVRDYLPEEVRKTYARQIYYLFHVEMDADCWDDIEGGNLITDGDLRELKTVTTFEYLSPSAIRNVPEIQRVAEAGR